MRAKGFIDGLIGPEVASVPASLPASVLVSALEIKSGVDACSFEQPSVHIAVAMVTTAVILFTKYVIMRFP